MSAEVHELKPREQSLSVDELLVDLRRNCTEPRVADAFEPENLASAIEIQSCQLVAGWRADLSEAALCSRLSNLICDLAYFGDSIGLDVEDGLRRSLARNAPRQGPIAIELNQRLSA